MKSCNLLGQKNHATSCDKKITQPLGTKEDDATSLKKNKKNLPSGDKKNYATSRGKKIDATSWDKKTSRKPLGTKNDATPRGKKNHATSQDKKSGNHLEQKITHPLRTKKNHATPGTIKNRTLNRSNWVKINP